MDQLGSDLLRLGHKGFWLPCGGLEPGGWLLILYVLLVAMWNPQDHGSDLFQPVLGMLNRIGIWGIQKPGQHLEVFATFLSSFLSCFSTVAGHIVLLVVAWPSGSRHGEVYYRSVTYMIALTQGFPRQHCFVMG